MMTTNRLPRISRGSGISHILLRLFQYVLFRSLLFYKYSSWSYLTSSTSCISKLKTRERKNQVLTYVVNVFSQSDCFERFLGVYAAGRPPTANQMTKHRSISEIINPLLNEAQFVFCKNREFLQKPGIFAKTGNLQNLGIFCKNREFLQKPGIYKISGFFCKNREFLQKPGIYKISGFFCKNREFLQKPGIYKISGFFCKNLDERFETEAKNN